jgi:hypothetical protein
MALSVSICARITGGLILMDPGDDLVRLGCIVIERSSTPGSAARR